MCMTRRLTAIAILLASNSGSFAAGMIVPRDHHAITPAHHTAVVALPPAQESQPLQTVVAPVTPSPVPTPTPHPVATPRHAPHVIANPFVQPGYQQCFTDRVRGEDVVLCTSPGKPTIEKVDVFSAEQCAAYATWVHEGALASEVVYDPASPCHRYGY